MRRIRATEFVAKQVGKFPTFPIRGVNGYAGEQDGDKALFFRLDGSKKYLMETRLVPEHAAVQWANYCAPMWNISFGVWESKLTAADRNALLVQGIFLV